MKRQLISTLRWMVIFLAEFPLTGCGPAINYVFTPPASPEGMVCISQCANSQQMCWSSNQNFYQQCINNHNWAMQNYNQCRNNAQNQNASNSCMMPPACYAPNNYYCEEGYRACYQACGGSVQAFVVPNP
ncbi:MAG: hypothetical protein EBT06_09445 [Gammaproteobacteria bacterium]|nr:hypothetical protein [Gammaproteobacteria bacterium]NBY23035.1 hypothetical protein [Gammaproteobacteria bacterium]